MGIFLATHVLLLKFIQSVVNAALLFLATFVTVLLKILLFKKVLVLKFYFFTETSPPRSYQVKP